MRTELQARDPTRTAAMQAGRTAMFGLSAALVESAWRDLQRRGVPVTAWQQPGWKWFSQQNYAAQVRVVTIPKKSTGGTFPRL